MWQFSQAVDGLSDACLELGHPGHRRQRLASTTRPATPPIHPTPVVGVLGIIDDVARRIPSGWQDEGENIYLLGATRDELDGSAWAARSTATSADGRPRSTCRREARSAEILIAGSRDGLLVRRARPLGGRAGAGAGGGLMRFGVGARVWLDEVWSATAWTRRRPVLRVDRPARSSRCRAPRSVRFPDMCAARGIPAPASASSTPRRGRAPLDVQGLFSVPLAELRGAHEGTLPAAFEA